MSDLWFLLVSVPIMALLWRGLEALLAAGRATDGSGRGAFALVK